jgi:hypothetical protein
MNKTGVVHVEMLIDSIDVLWFVGSSMINIEGSCRFKQASERRPFCPSESLHLLCHYRLPKEKGGCNLEFFPGVLPIQAFSRQVTTVDSKSKFENPDDGTQGTRLFNRYAGSCACRNRFEKSCLPATVRATLALWNLSVSR